MNIKFSSIILLSTLLLLGLAGAAPLADGASKFLGNITTNGQVRSDFGTYWNQITAENECKWSSVEGTRGQYNFAGCDRAFNWARDNGGTFKFHALIWGAQYPNWLPSLSVEDTRTAITQWFDAVKRQYPEIDMIDVVNEAIRTGTNQYHSGYTNTKIIAALGGDNNGDYTFVTTAFEMAEERWPNAILIYNDYNTIRWQINEGIDLIKKIKAAGAPVDAYGHQAHDVTDMNVTDFRNALERIYNETQIPFFISEYDIGTTNDAYQRQRYSEQIPIMMDLPYIAGITLWGYIYGSTWLNETVNGVEIRGVSGIIKDGVDRPAMTWLKEYMASNDGVNTTGLLGSTPPLPDTVPQAPYQGVITIPGTVEAENYDVGGQTQSYFDSDVANQGDAYRDDRVDVVAISNGHAIGYTTEGEWLEYTVNVESAGVYTYEATVASGADASSFRLYMDDNAITDQIEVANGGNWQTYSTISGNTTALSTGTHILKIEITGSYVDIDKIRFTQEAPTNFAELKSSLIQFNQGFEVYSVTGTYVGSYTANSISDLNAQMHRSNLNRGIYLVRSNNMSRLMSIHE
jgi:GH35 family endo-1,4-beta-xylanase